MRKARWGVAGLLLIAGALFFFLYHTHTENPAKIGATGKSASRLPQSVIDKAPAKMVIPQPGRPAVIPAAGQPEPTTEKAASPRSNHPLAKDNTAGEEPIPKVFFGYLKLVGVITSGYNPLKNKAIIENRLTSRQKLYPLGAATPYGARIKKIEEQGITLEKEGVEKRLSISGELGDLADIAVLKAKGYKRIAEREWLITPNSLIKDTAYLFQLVSEISIRPQFNSMSIKGLKLKDIKSDGVIKELGLKAGDMINSVNGSSLNINSVAGAYDIYRQISNEPSIKLGLSREQHELNLTYHIISDGPPNYSLRDVISSPRMAKLFMDKE